MCVVNGMGIKLPHHHHAAKGTALHLELVPTLAGSTSTAAASTTFTLAFAFAFAFAFVIGPWVRLRRRTAVVSNTLRDSHICRVGDLLVDEIAPGILCGAVSISYRRRLKVQTEALRHHGTASLTPRHRT